MSTNLPKLLSACAQAAFLAGSEIRQVVESNEDLQVIDKTSSSTSIATTSATVGDPQTIADRKAQFVILTLLRKHFPNVHYIAEEEEEEFVGSIEEIKSDIAIDENHIPRSFFQESTEQEENSEHVSIWVDPLDGTQMFLGKQYSEVSVLIGVAVNGRPVLGVIHLPFTYESYVGYYNSTSRFVIRGSYKDGVAQWKPFDNSYKSSTSNKIRIITSPKPSTKRDALLKEFNTEEVRLTYSSAVGTMILKVLKGQVDLYLRCREGTMCWDFCACNAVLLAAGGTLVDCYGNPYYYNAQSSSYKNMHGAFGTLNMSLLKKFLTQMSEINEINF